MTAVKWRQRRTNHCSKIKGSTPEEIDHTRPGASGCSHSLSTVKDHMIVGKSRFQIEKVILFLDSKIVLAWISSEAKRFKPFVSVRVGEIKTKTDPTQWKHVRGEMNIADDVSRGIPVRHLVERWQHGPKFLRLPENERPQDSSTNDHRKLKKNAVKFTINY